MGGKALDALGRLLDFVDRPGAAFTVALLVLIWRSPEIIKAISYLRRENRKSRTKTQERKDEIRRDLSRARSQQKGEKE